MNPDTNRLESLTMDPKLKRALDQEVEGLKSAIERQALVRPDGSPVPEHWSIFTVGECVAIKTHTFRVAYIGESTLLLEPIGPVLVGQDGDCDKIPR